MIFFISKHRITRTNCPIYFIHNKSQFQNNKKFIIISIYCLTFKLRKNKNIHVYLWNIKLISKKKSVIFTNSKIKALNFKRNDYFIFESIKFANFTHKFVHLISLTKFFTEIIFSLQIS